MEEESNLGSLGQSARSNQLKSARWIMIFVGILTLGFNAFQFVTARSALDEEVTELALQGLQVEPSEVEQALLEAQAVSGIGVVLGVIFVALGIIVYKFPVPCTLLGLVLYVGANIGFGVLDPTTVARGIIVKVLIAIGLIKSVRSAFAYQAEKDMQAQAGFGATADVT